MIESIIAEINLKINCKVFPNSGLPIVKKNSHQLPSDLEKFYTICGGVTLFEGSDYSITIVPPEEFLLANPMIVGQLIEEDRSSNWYIIGTDRDSQYITIDLSLEKRGRCYDSFIETHGLVGESPVIANSFTELLKNLAASNGEYWYWLKEDFISLGDAYDDDYEL